MPGRSEGHVPLERIRSLLIEKLHIEDGHFSTDHPELVCLTRMWDDGDRIWKALNDTGQSKGQFWMEFNVADKLLCLLGLQGCWWDELADVYYSVDLTKGSIARTAEKDEVRCANPACSVTFSPFNGGRRKVYCTAACKNQHWSQRHKAKRSEGAQGRTLKSKRYDTCPHGHDRSPENAVWEKGSKGKPVLRCRECLNRKARDRRARLRGERMAA